MAKLKTKNEQYYGKKMNLPILGVVQIDEQGCIETDNKQVIEILTEQTTDWELLNAKNGKGVAEKIIEDPNKTEEETEEEDSGSSINYDELELDELIKVAEDAQIPVEEYEKFKNKRKLMINFLKKQK